VAGVFVLAGFTKTFLQFALNQRLRRYHHEVWSNMATSEYFPLRGFPVLGFVVSGEFRKVPDRRVQRLGAALLSLHRGLPVIWVLGVALVVWFLWSRSGA